MPSTHLKNTDPGFLRDINFSALADGLIRNLFGKAERPAWMKFKISSFADVLEMQTVFGLIVDLDPQPAVDFGGSGFRVGPKRRRRGFTVEFRVPDRVLVEFRDDFPKMFCVWLEKAITENAHKFYELDPRIGWRCTGTDAELSVSPLFDPPAPFSRTGHRVHVKSDPEDPAVLVEPRCPFCREPHEDGTAPIWGGANLRWVHHHCWRGS